MNFASATPCQYWFDNSWYDLTNIGSVGSTNFWTSPPNIENAVVSFNFCQKLNAGSDVEQLACDDLDLYALEYDYISVGSTNCVPLSTSTLHSIN